MSTPIRRRQVGYQWRLRELMAERGLFTTVELVPLLTERGITLSASQVHRLVTGTPERLSLAVLAALCDVFDVTPADLITTTAANVTTRAADATTAQPTDIRRTDGGGAIRPTRARIRPEQRPEQRPQRPQRPQR
jgi:DNA-binding Xre family transcriptional regulator